MAVEAALLPVLIAAAVGLAISVLIERLMTPRPALSRPLAAWGLHVGSWLLAFATLTLILGRPWFATAGVSAFLLMLVLVNNAKIKALREAFVFQDYEYFMDAIRHPRLYMPFLGWWKFLGATAGFTLAVAIGLWGEGVPDSRLDWSGQLGGITAAASTGVACLIVANGGALPVSFDPNRDMRTLGLLASFWCYAKARRDFPVAASPFDFLAPIQTQGDPPHLVAVQSESFFDPRSRYPGIRPDVLAEFDRLKTEALAHGRLKVPAWGANTVRTEFAFLSGLNDRQLGVHRFNPYRAITLGWEVPSLASYLKHLGYRTLCIHPYPASFYQRDCVYPRLGFDQFLDIRAFESTERFGPYISDAAVAKKITDILDKASGPVFVFAITMENHGPLHLERVETSDVDKLYTQAPPPGCEDLTVYLRHLRNADKMIGTLRKALEHCSRPTTLCWFGDHVPIMPAVYKILGEPDGEVEYVLWNSWNKKTSMQKELAASQLSTRWLRMS